MIARQSQKYATRHTTHLEGRTNHHDDCYICTADISRNSERRHRKKFFFQIFHYQFFLSVVHQA